MSDYQATIPEIANETEHVPIEQLAEGQRRIKEYLLAHMPTNVATREQWEEIFSPDNPANVAPSSDVAGSVAYSRPGCEKWNHAKRQRTSLGRYLGRNCKLAVSEDYCQRVISQAVASVGDIYPIALQFELVHGDAILKAYRDSVGSSSCMTGGETYYQQRLTLYSNNPNAVGLLIWRKTRGRALLWNLDCGERYLDRIYSGDYAGAPVAYRQYCKANGILYAYDGLLGNGCVSGTVTLENHGYATPYFDSFSSRKRVDSIVLTINGLECHHCGCSINADDCNSVNGGDNYVCDECYSEHYFMCSDCDETFHNDYYNCVANGSSVCDDCLSSGYFRCNDCDEYHSTDDENQTDHDESVCNGCAENYVVCHCCDKLVSTN